MHFMCDDLGSDQSHCMKRQMEALQEQQQLGMSNQQQHTHDMSQGPERRHDTSEVTSDTSSQHERHHDALSSQSNSASHGLTQYSYSRLFCVVLLACLIR